MNDTVDKSMDAFRHWISKFKTKCLTGEAAAMTIMDAALYQHYRYWWERFSYRRIMSQAEEDAAAHGWQAGVEWKAKEIEEEIKKRGIK